MQKEDKKSPLTIILCQIKQKFNTDMYTQTKHKGLQEWQRPSSIYSFLEQKRNI